MGGTETSDEALMLQYRDGDATAFDLLYARHKGALFRYCLRHCRERSTAEETFQDVWMRVIGARRRYEPRAKFTTWLYRIAHNRVIDGYRSDNPGRFQPLDDDGEIGALPAAERDVFLLHEEAGLGLDAIAEVSGVGRETAKSRLRYALSKLRAALKDTQ
jgi:RNA polymerase sigma-70 factor (ECF subfamily)